MREKTAPKRRRVMDNTGGLSIEAEWSGQELDRQPRRGSAIDSGWMVPPCSKALKEQATEIYARGHANILSRHRLEGCGCGLWNTKGKF